MIVFRTLNRGVWDVTHPPAHTLTHKLAYTLTHPPTYSLRSSFRNEVGGKGDNEEKKEEEKEE